jgi:hypothetical protein
MPIIGKFYSSEELQKLLGVSKQRIYNLARAQNWQGPQKGLYYAQSVEWYLMSRGIDPHRLPEINWDFPEGETIANQLKMPP